MVWSRSASSLRCCSAALGLALTTLFSLVGSASSFAQTERRTKLILPKMVPEAKEVRVPQVAPGAKRMA